MNWPRWLLIGLIAVEVVLVATGRLGLGAALIVIGVLELLVAVILIVVAWRTGRSTPGPLLARVEAAVAAVSGPVVARLITTELRLFRAVWLALRHRRDVPPGAIGIGYARGRWAAPALLGFAALLELFAIDLLVPWERFGRYYGLRWVMLALSAYGVLWVLMWVLAEKTHPHLLTDEALLLRKGPMVAMRIPRTSITSATPHGLADPGDDTATFTAPLVAANVELRLLDSVPLLGWFGKEKGAFERIALAVDEPTETIRRLRPGR